MDKELKPDKEVIKAPEFFFLKSMNVKCTVPVFPVRATDGSLVPAAFLLSTVAV